MSSDLARHPRLERHLARLLSYGTWLASGIIAAGLAAPLIGWHGIGLETIGTHTVAFGIALFILLPVLRVLAMLIVFAQEGDRRFIAIAMLVLAIIAVSAFLGWRASAGVPG